MESRHGNKIPSLMSNMSMQHEAIATQGQLEGFLLLSGCSVHPVLTGDSSKEAVFSPAGAEAAGFCAPHLRVPQVSDGNGALWG